MSIQDELRRQIAELADDRTSGSSELFDRAAGLLRTTLQENGPVTDVARAICRAQPSMGSLWNLALAALAGRGDIGRYEAFVKRAARADAALAAFAREVFEEGAVRHPLRLVTLSFSRTVLNLVVWLAQTRQVEVACAEGRPALEGQRMATALASHGISVSYYTDGALAHALPAAEAAIVGADAITTEGVINKCGTRMLAAAASHAGLPVYVAAPRAKFVGSAVSRLLTIRENNPSEVWNTPPAGVSVHNPYFEITPLDLITAAITDVGLLAAALIPDVCAAHAEDALLAELLDPSDRV